MVRILKLVIALFITISICLPTTLLAAAPPQKDESPDTIMVAFRPGTAASDIAQLNRNNNATVRSTIPALGVQVLSFAPGKAAGMLTVYQKNPNVIYAEPDAGAMVDEVSNDTYTAQQWGLAKVNAGEAWSVTTGSSTVKIAVLDTGIDPNHPDLAGKVVDTVNFSTSGTADDIKGHGTHVAGIAAAIPNNGIGVAGLGYDTSLMNVKVLGDEGTGSYSAIAQGIVWAADNGADVINMSLSGTSASVTLENAVEYAWSKGVVVVASAGNNGNSTPVYPAYYTDAMAVASTDSSDNLSGFSNFGNWVDVAAPGSSIMATLTGGAYGYKSGTSMAAPFVSALAGLLKSIAVDADGDGQINDEVRAVLESTAQNIGVTGVGGGRIDAAAAVAGMNYLEGSQPVPGPAPETPIVEDVWIGAIDFKLKGKNLEISASAVGLSGPVANVTVTLSVTNGAKQFQLVGTSDVTGNISVSIQKPETGVYLIEVVSVVGIDHQWDGQTGITSAEFEIAGSSGPSRGKSANK